MVKKLQKISLGAAYVVGNFFYLPPENEKELVPERYSIGWLWSLFGAQCATVQEVLIYSACTYEVNSEATPSCCQYTLRWILYSALFASSRGQISEPVKQIEGTMVCVYLIEELIASQVVEKWVHVQTLLGS